MDKDYLQDLFIEEVKPALNWHSTADEYADGYEKGKKSQYDEFWDKLQRNGTRTDYYYAFSFWMDELFYPKYDMLPTKCDNMFYWIAVEDLAGRLRECGVKFDICNATSTDCVFQYATKNKTCPHLTTKENAKLPKIFYYASGLETIEKLTLVGVVTFGDQTFYKCNELKNIVIEGTIYNTFNISAATPLTVDSAKSIINALANYKGTENEGIYSVKFASAVWTRLEESGPAPDGGTWKNYVQSLGWLI